MPSPVARMETFAILGFVFGLIAFAMVGKLSNDIKHLRRQMEELERRLPVALKPG